jgi:amidophosphoribosyltransferase
MERKACSFERIYFSRGTDRDIYLERKKLGELLTESVLKEVNYDIKNTVFTFIPNTAEVSFFGMMDEIHHLTDEMRKKQILALGKDATEEQINEIMAVRPRIEKLAVKDAKMRTFIADDVVRGEMVAHVYDVTYGIINNEVDTIVAIDDSIVRGTTLRDSIITNLSRLKPKKIVIVSSAPQIRYPDCYGIDMSKMNEFVAFKALVALLKDTKQEHKLVEVYELCKAQEALPLHEMTNQVKQLYDLFSYEQLSDKISVIVTPEGTKPEIKVIYQTIEDLHEACPNNTGDWYFSGNYPTVGGVRVVNRAFINYMEGNNKRAY